MLKKIPTAIGIVMIIIADCFVIYAFSHPEAGFVWNRTITNIIYIVYSLVATTLLLSPLFGKRKNDS